MILSSIAFDSPWFLLGLIPVALLLAYLMWRRHAHRDPAMRFPSSELVEGLPTTIWVRLIWLPDALRALALTMIVVALARPQVLGPPSSEETEGIDIIMVLDTSGSMRAADFQPKDRMFVAKKSIADFVKQRTTDRIGLVVFAGEAASWVPLTLDYSLLVDMLDEVEVGMLQDGTAIGSAIGTGLNRLRDSEAASRVIVLLTDGDNNAGTISPKKAAEFAKELGISVYTILIGRGGPVPVPAGKDVFGRVIYRKHNLPTNPALLQEIATKTGGQAYRAQDGKELDERLFAVLDNLERTRLENTVHTTPKEELFPFFILFGLLSLALEILLRTTRLERFP